MTAALIARNTFREATRDRVLLGVVIAGGSCCSARPSARPARARRGARGSPWTSGSAASRCSACSSCCWSAPAWSPRRSSAAPSSTCCRARSRRHAYLIGKWAGAHRRAVGGARRCSGSALWLGAGAARPGRATGRRSLQAVYLAGLELSVITAIAVLFSALSTPVLSALYTLGLLLRRASGATTCAAFADAVPGRAAARCCEMVANLVPEPAALQHARAGRRAASRPRVDPPRRSRPLYALRLLRLRAGARRRAAFEIAGLQVSRGAASAPRARRVVARLGAWRWCSAPARSRSRRSLARALPRPQPLEELSYYPSGQHLQPATLGHAETRGRSGLAARGPVLRRAPAAPTTASRAWSTCSTSSPRSSPALRRRPTCSARFALAQEGSDFAAAERLMLKGIEANPRERAARLRARLPLLRAARRARPAPGRRVLRAGRAPARRPARRPRASPPSPASTPATCRSPTSCGARCASLDEPLPARDGRARDAQRSAQAHRRPGGRSWRSSALSTPQVLIEGR